MILSVTTLSGVPDKKTTTRSLCDLSIYDRFRVCAVSYVAYKHFQGDISYSRGNYMETMGEAQTICVKGNITLDDDTEEDKLRSIDMIPCAINKEVKDADFYLTNDPLDSESAFIVEPLDRNNPHSKEFRLASHVRDLGALKPFSDRIIHGPKVSKETIQTLDHYNDFGAYLRDISEQYMDKVFMVEAKTGRSYTWGSLLEQSHKIAVYLRENGFSEGSVVGVIFENSFRFPLYFMASLNIGAIYTSIDPRLTPSEMVHLLSVSKPSVVFTTSTLYEKIKNEVSPRCSSIKMLVNIEDVNYPEQKYDKQNFQYPVKIMHNVTSNIMYSSGTTGLPKGVMQSHIGWIFESEVYRTEKVITLPPDNISTGLLPTGRTYELWTLMLSFVLGHTYVSVENQEEIFDYIERYKINTVFSNPYSASFLARDERINAHDLSSVQVVVSGGDFLHTETQELLKERFGCDIWNVFGMTETTAVTINLKSSEPIVGITGSLIPGVSVKIVDFKTGKALGPNQRGEFCMRGPLLMNGYLGAAAGDGVDNDGWLHSGDIAYYDEDNNIHMEGRVKMLMKCAGCQVSPVELELLIMDHPEVEDVVVVPVPDKVHGDELPRAYVVKKPQSTVTAADIEKYVENNMSPMKWLRGGVRFVPMIPKTNAKVDRKIARGWVETKDF